MKTVRFEQDGAIGSIVLANPPFNRIDSAYATNLLDAVHRASESGIRVLVVRAEGQNFSFGGEVREWPGKDVNWFRTFVAEVNQSYRAIEALRVPTLASVQGIAMGGGFELALACDLIIAAEDAVFRNVEVTTGMVPIAGGMQRLAAHVGRARAARMAIFGDGVPAPEGFKLGFVSHLVPAARTHARDRRRGAPSGDRAHPRLRGRASTVEDVGQRRRRCRRCSDARHNDGPVRQGGRPHGIRCFGKGVRRKRRAPVIDVRW